MDIRECSKIVRQNYNNIQTSDKISEQNKEDIKESSDTWKIESLATHVRCGKYRDFRPVFKGYFLLAQLLA